MKLDRVIAVVFYHYYAVYRSTSAGRACSTDVTIRDLLARLRCMWLLDRALPLADSLASALFMLLHLHYSGSSLSFTVGLILS
jgi:hypothetical protein